MTYIPLRNFLWLATLAFSHMWIAWTGHLLPLCLCLLVVDNEANWKMRRLFFNPLRDDAGVFDIRILKQLLFQLRRDDLQGLILERLFNPVNNQHGAILIDRSNVACTKSQLAIVIGRVAIFRCLFVSVITFRHIRPWHQISPGVLAEPSASYPVSSSDS